MRIATPTLSWEVQGFRVNEGPAVLIRNGRVFVTFSASATDARYCMGLLTADENANLLDARSWTKTPNPVFATNAETRQFGPGHNSFTVAEDGVTDVLVYHARDYRDITGDPLYDPNRHTRVQKLYWNADGTPAFGVPVGKGGPIVRLSPLDAPNLVVRHAEFRLRVEGNVREVADSWFRFVPGHLGAGTVSVQSVNFPDRLRARRRGRAADRAVRGHRRVRPRDEFRPGAGTRRSLGRVIAVAGRLRSVSRARQRTARRRPTGRGTRRTGACDLPDRVTVGHWTARGPRESWTRWTTLR